MHSPWTGSGEQPVTIYRIYTLSADGGATLRKEVSNSTDRDAIKAALSLCGSLPDEKTWLLDCDQAPPTALPA
jgi:hypothetical protein